MGSHVGCWVSRETQGKLSLRKIHQISPILDQIGIRMDVEGRKIITVLAKFTNVCVGPVNTYAMCVGAEISSD